MIDKVEKGLGLCSASNDTRHCWQCPYNRETQCIECLTQNALDILTKLQSENEALKAELGAAQRAINSMKSKLRAAGLQTPIELPKVPEFLSKDFQFPAEKEGTVIHE